MTYLARITSKLSPSCLLCQSSNYEKNLNRLTQIFHYLLNSLLILLIQLTNQILKKWQ